ncbi:uncharacterized protein LOC115214358 isoform X1 [Octopus sinensis]|uniref:Uncharacterized protein LOC115214358 isoform X1 n=1 Tax=Octopus sinensis TaxID=2607531 RepID=A0A6P7SNG5_9MOLL|nr:uncharacterized protein LOC115214358 isoform X1 [Octopus sinensis]
MYTPANASRNRKILGLRRGPPNSLDPIEGRGDGNSTSKRPTVGHHTAAMRCGHGCVVKKFTPQPCDFRFSITTQHLGSQKSVFNGKRAVSVHRQNSYPSESQSQHDDIVKYLTDSWNKVVSEPDSRHPRDNKAWSRFSHDMDNRHQRIIKSSNPTWYKEKCPNPQMENFKPFDLDKWCNQRTLEKPRGTT